ncbi:Putative 2EXR domain-containing protein [Colletotrichum destructivum]|uniref:2EXR domain-containing protein n=1 Tax=Colletotrichum destructivum TaxID=34406 RepID=A0AAX4I3L5_9PEZI|nr:Putative 2EXR domain-containing protein [Colletotrichum destructivum]
MDTIMADNSPPDPMAAAASALMNSIQCYVRAAVAAESANSRPESESAIQARLDTVVQENTELKDKLKQIENERDTIKAAFSSYFGVALPESKLSRHLRLKIPKFPQFKSFPVEIRMKIWKLALPAGRVFDLSMGDGHLSRVLRATAPNPNGGPNPAVAMRQASGLAEMTVTAHKTPKLRLVCKEANRAFLEAGGFEFGLFGGTYKGLWFNYAEDILFVREEPRAWVNLDMSRIVRVAFPHTRFMSKPDIIARLDLVLDHFTSCKEVILMQTMEWDIRSCLTSPRLPPKLFPLGTEDPIGAHDYPKELSNEIGNVAAWGDVKRVVEQIGREHVMDVKHLSPGRVPKFIGMEMVRARPSYFD